MGWTVFYAININPAYVFDQCCHSLFVSLLSIWDTAFSFFLEFSLGTVPGFYYGSLVLGFAYGLFHASCMTKILQQWVEGDPFDRSALLCDIPVQYFRLNLKGQSLLHRSHQSMWRNFLGVHLYILLIKKRLFLVIVFLSCLYIECLLPCPPMYSVPYVDSRSDLLSH